MSLSTEQRQGNPKDVGIFWDYENVHIPARCSSPLKACTEIVKVAKKYGRIQQRRVYSDYSRDDSNVAWWSADISESGFDLVSTPRRGATKSKETLDRKMIQDIIFFAWDVLDRGRSPCVVLITSDGDFAYTINKLRDRGAANVVIHGSNASKLLENSADVALNLEKDVLPQALLQRTTCRQGQLDGYDPLGNHSSIIQEQDLNAGVHVAPQQLDVQVANVADYAKPLVQYTAEHTRKDAMDLLRALMGISLDWVFGSQLGLNFRDFIVKREPTTADLKTRFRLASAQAVEEKWMLQGRQRILTNGTMGEIVTLSTQVIPPTGVLTKHSFVKLTESGKILVTMNSNSTAQQAATKVEDAAKEETKAETGKQHFGSIETESSTSASSSSEGSWKQVPVKVIEPRCGRAASRDISACLFIKNIPSQVNLYELVRHLEGKTDCTVLQASAKQLAHSSPFYFARVVLETSEQATILLGLANAKKLELAGRVMTAAFDRWPATNDWSAADSSLRYKRGKPYHTMSHGWNTHSLYIENLPNGTDIRDFVKQIETRYSVTFQQAILADGAKPYDNFWNAHAVMKTSPKALEFLRIGRKNSEKTSQLMYGGRWIWVKQDNSAPDWSALKEVNSERFYCASN